MKGDFTRSTFDPKKHYSGVRMQQGRVQLDADWNEQLDIQSHRVETEAYDVIGKCGAPKHNPGFKVITGVTSPTAEEQALLDDLAPGDFLVGKGRFYVNGVLCENEDYVAFTAQPDLPGTKPVQQAGVYALYLDVWQRHITALEDPSIREVALGGPDTATRTRTVWQLKLELLPDGDKATCSDEVEWPANGSGRLSARAEPPASPEGPCVVAPGAGYRRLENQLYRVEIHQNSAAAGGATFKWSRDNGSVVVAVEAFNHGGDAARVRVKSLGRDRVLGLHMGDLVEVLDDARELYGIPGELLTVGDIDFEHNVLTLSGPVPAFDMGLHPKIRRWDCGQELAVADALADFVELEDGVQVKFEAGDFNTGDYWLIPARTVPGKFGDVEWPRDNANNPVPLPQRGVYHHYCKIAIVTFEGSGEGIEIEEVEDCRPIFPPLTELPKGGASCCTVTAGEGGDFKDIQAAIDAAENGTRVCILPGLHDLAKPVVIDDRLNLVISGCGLQTRITGPEDGPAFLITNECRNIKLDSLDIISPSEAPAVAFKESEDLVLSNCRLRNSPGEQPEDDAPLLSVFDCDRVRIEGNDLSQTRTMRAITVRGTQVEIAKNSIKGGGILVHYGTIGIAIRGNEITMPPGRAKQPDGPGIQLGSTKDKVWPLPIVRAEILDNTIYGMRGSAITTPLDFESEAYSPVEYLTIARNRMTENLREPSETMILEEVSMASVVLLYQASQVGIYDNVIAYNGSQKNPIVGLFVMGCENLDVQRNTIADNGSVRPAETLKGFQAGIIASLVKGRNRTSALKDHLGGAFTPEVFKQQQAGMPAVRIHDNLISTPSGQALLLVSLGSVSVTDNSLTSRGWHDQPLTGLEDFKKTLCVAVLAMGTPEFPIKQDMEFTWEAIKALAKEGKEEVARLPGGRVSFNNNQVTITGDIPVVGVLKRVGDDQEDIEYGPSGIFLMSADDIALENNQVRAITSGPPMLTDAYAYATTVRAVGNRLAEYPETAIFSYVGEGLALNITTGNEATHYISANGLVANNLALIEI